MAPIRGVAHVAYLPGERVVGISKLARLVDAYARRLQIQERMTNEIADTLDRVLHPRGVAVVIQASHECISSRGLGMHGVAMATRRLTGQFERDPWRRDILPALAACRSRPGLPASCTQHPTRQSKRTSARCSTRATRPGRPG